MPAELLSQFVMVSVVEPSLDRRYPLSRSRRVTPAK
ncbi:hypothetical protein ABH929_000273 [Curtobacterium sp. AB7]